MIPLETSFAPVDALQALPSPDGKFILIQSAFAIEIRKISDLSNAGLVRVLPYMSSSSESTRLCWAPRYPVETATRFLVADDRIVRVFDLQDEEWVVMVSLTKDTSGGFANVDFGGDGAEVMLYCSKTGSLTLISLWSRRQVEIKYPKSLIKGQERNKLFAVLSRPEAKDIVTIHAPGSYHVLATFHPATTDAHGISWSPDGNLLAIWEEASFGYRVLIYTSKGQLFRQYCGDHFADLPANLGVKSLEWSPDGQYLAISSHDNNYLKLLNATKMTTAIELFHSPIISPKNATIHVEQATSAGAEGREYKSPDFPHYLPKAQHSILGISMVAFNATGTLVATRCDAYPTTIYIWNLVTQRPQAVIVQHSRVKDFSWHYNNPNWLLIHCNQSEPLVYIWKAEAVGSSGSPEILCLDRDSPCSGTSWVSWLRSDKDEMVIFCGEAGRHCVVWPYGSPDRSSLSQTPHRRTSLSQAEPAETWLEQNFDALNDSVDDTFEYRHALGAI